MIRVFSGWSVLLVCAFIQILGMSSCAGTRKTFFSPETGFHTIGNPDILWHKVVYREMNLLHKQNQPLQSIADSVGIKSNFNSFLYDVLKEGIVDIYISTDSTGRQADSRLLSNYKNGRDIEKYVMVEEWFFVRDSGKVYVRIIGIGPRIPGDKLLNSEAVSQAADGTYDKCDDASVAPSFYIKYSQLAPYLKSHFLRRDDKKFSCHDFFEERSFSSRIVCIRMPSDTTADIQVPLSMSDFWVY